MKAAVLIPTARRPAMLAAALQSLTRQSALAAIERIVVSENGGDRSSEAVCGQFSGLPIRYVFRDPPVPVAEHGRILLHSQTDVPLLAVLCDDDWWAPSHLDSALRALAANSSAVAYASAYLAVRDEDAGRARIEVPIAARIAASDPRGTCVWPLSPTQLLATAVVETPFHLSSIVAQGDGLRRAYQFATQYSHWSVDRLTFAALALSGPVLFDPLVSVYVRLHGGNDMQRFSPTVRRSLMPEARAGVEALAQSLGIDLRAYWRDIAKTAPRKYRGRLFSQVNHALGFRGAMDYHLGEYLWRHRLAWHAYRLVRWWAVFRGGD